MLFSVTFSVSMLHVRPRKVGNVCLKCHVFPGIEMMMNEKEKDSYCLSVMLFVADFCPVQFVLISQLLLELKFFS